VHRLRSKTSIRRFRFAAFLLWLNHFMILVTVAFWAHLVFYHHPQDFLTGLGLLLFLAALTILRWIVSSRTNCPLCLTAVLAVRACTKHRRARTFLGSHRIAVAHSILFKNSFCCPYCNESTALELRRNYRVPLGERIGEKK
jgi:hypothetical protein